MEKIREGESQKREDAGARKGRKVSKHYVFLSRLEFPLGNGDPGPHDLLENRFHMFPKFDYLHSLETFLYLLDLA